MKKEEDISGSFSFTAACPLREGWGGDWEIREGGEARHVVVALGCVGGGRGRGGVNLFK